VYWHWALLAGLAVCAISGSCCLSIYRFGNGLLGFHFVVFLKWTWSAECLCDVKYKAFFQGNMCSFFLNFTIPWFLRNLESGAWPLSILSQNFLFQSSHIRTKCRKPEWKVASLWHWWFVAGFDEVGRKGDMKGTKELLIRLKCISVTCGRGENIK
jgi:hypothetical protein